MQAIDAIDFYSDRVAKTKESDSLKLITCDDLLARAAHGELIENLLPRTGLACVYGPSGAGKSFLVLDMAMAISRGVTSWFGHRLNKAPVIYIGLEGQGGLQKRLKAYQLHTGCSLPDGFHWCVDEPFALAPESDSAERLAASIEKIGINAPVVFLDTFSQAAAGSDLNGPEGMGRAISACQGIMRAMPGGLLILVHHATSKQDATDDAFEMGHSSFRGALDASILVREVKGADGAPPHRCWRLKKHKEAQTDVQNPFHLKAVTVGVNEWDNPSTSCVIVPITTEALAEEKRQAKTGIAIDFFRAMARAEAESGKGWKGMLAKECQAALADLGVTNKSNQLALLKEWTHTMVKDGPILVQDGSGNTKLHRINRGFKAPSEWQPFPPRSDLFNGEWPSD